MTAGSGETTTSSPEASEASQANANTNDTRPGYTQARITGLVLSPLLFAQTLAFFKPEGLSTEAQAVLASTLWVATWWITKAIPISVASLLPIVLLPLTNALDGDTVVSS